MPEARLFARIAKVDATKREVHGVLAEEAPDKAKEIFDYSESKPYFQKWNESFQSLTAHLDAELRSVGNVREMHTKAAAGKFINMDYDDVNKCINVIAKIEDDQAWRKVCTGVYTGFSIGGDYVRKYDDPTLPGHKRYVAMPTEGSLVDNPCMYGATFKLFKGEGTESLVKFVGEEEALAKAETKRVDGVDLPSTAFLIVGDKDDTKTWHLPISFPTEEDTVTHIQRAMADLPAVEGITHQVKSGAARRLMTMAGKHGVTVKDTKDFAEKFLTATLPTSLKKCMYDVSRMADMMQSLAYLESSLQDEADREKDGSKVPERLRESIKGLSAIFVDMANEEAAELAASVSKEATANAGNNLTKGGGPNMATTNTASQGAGEGQAPDQLKKYEDQLKKNADRTKKVSELLLKVATGLEEIRKGQEEIEDATLSISSLGKSATPKNLTDTLEVIKAASAKIKTHSDQTEAVIEEIEGEVEAETDKLLAQKSNSTLVLMKRMERSFERRIALQERQHQGVVSSILDGIEKMVGGNGNAAPVTEPVTPARTVVAVEKNEDGAAVGGVVLQKSAPAGAPAALAAAGGVPPVDAHGMPNPAFIEKATGSEFVNAVKKTQLQAGNPFPKEFGSATIY